GDAEFFSSPDGPPWRWGESSAGLCFHQYLLEIKEYRRRYAVDAGSTCIAGGGGRCSLDPGPGGARSGRPRAGRTQDRGPGAGRSSATRGRIAIGGPASGQQREESPGGDFVGGQSHVGPPAYGNPHAGGTEASGCPAARTPAT